ncbi:CLUMA_CG018771, isoform A [Clunio marinus]|uniref:CLUMA_CG018771, isoform A n=1 Tax=Clunio marinus TaxID=568069 RepID=A0A1J1J2R8_9DIPT|nr:CLUMA_CG018771, isoform A [Clunio marinus]
MLHVRDYILWVEEGKNTKYHLFTPQFPPSHRMMDLLEAKVHLPLNPDCFSQQQLFAYHLRAHHKLETYTSSGDFPRD